KSCIGLAANVTPRVTQEDLTVVRAQVSGKECLQVIECHLSAAAIESSAVTDDGCAHLEARFERMLAVQDGEVVNDLVDVIGAIKLRKARATADRPGEAGNSDVGKSTVRRIIDQVNAVAWCSVGARAVSREEPLVKVVKAET